jgi:hypothetical protein
MADEDEEAGPVVELGEGDPVEGAPLARVASRLYYGIEKSEVVRREGETTVRTPDGPRELGDVLGAVDATYFDTRQAFVDAVEGVVGTGPVPTSDEGRDADDAEDEGDGDADAEDADDGDADAEDADDGE